MRLLLDTHAFLWWLAGNRRLSPAARRAVDDTSNDVVVSAATAWEITTKHRVGKLPEAEAVALDVTGSIASQGFDELAITVEDAERAGRLPGTHRDPDRPHADRPGVGAQFDCCINRRRVRWIRRLSSMVIRPP